MQRLFSPTKSHSTNCFQTYQVRGYTSRSTLGPLLMVILGTLTLISGAAQGQQFPQAGRNVNMVAGRHWPGGDPFLQRQNEPSIAVSSRNPRHLLAGANDYRTVDLPGVPHSGNTGDAWLGLFKSFDGGDSWTSTLIPGYPQDMSTEGQFSPLKGYQAGSDPTVRAGVNGLFYYSGIVFTRGEPARSLLFVARYVDNNNKETGDPIQYIDTNVVQRGDEEDFLDKPWLAVDIPRHNSRDCSIQVPNGDGTSTARSFPGGNVYIAYAEVPQGEDAEEQQGLVSTRIMFSRSTDCGATWEPPYPLSTPQTTNQGSTIAVDPNTGTVYVAWRQILSQSLPSSSNAIMIAKSTNGGVSFGRPVVVSQIVPFDLVTFPTGRPCTNPTSPDCFWQFRSLAFPTLAIDANPNHDQAGRVYVGWSQRGSGPGGDARVLVAVSRDGDIWSSPQLVDAAPDRRGHQLMPSATFSAGKLLFVYYDFRDDLRLQFSDLFVTDPITSIPTGWHTVDVRAAEADPANRPVFTSAPVSKYLFGVGTSGVPQRLQASPVNYPMFAQGTVPFMGDYIDVTAPAFVQDDHGRWRFNTEASNSATFTTAWTDNRDVKPPAKPEDWTKYTPPGALAGTQSLIDPHKILDACSPTQAGMRNENIYSARITQGFAASSPGNTKPLGKIQRAFVVYVENSTKHPRSYRLTIANQPSDGQASFLQFELRTTLDVAVGPRSTVARTVFVTSANSKNSTTVNVTEIASIGGFPVVGGFQGNVVLNPDILNPDILNPDILNPDILNPDIRDSEVSAPNISVTALNPDILNPDILNPDILNPDILNPDILNPDILNPDILNPDILNPDILNPDILNPDILNPDILNTDPDVQNADRSRLQVNDLSWTINNNGNTTSAFSFKTSFPAPPPGFKFQLMVYRVSSTPATSHCALVNQPHEQLVVNVLNPDILNPDILNPDILNPDIRNTTFFIAPGEGAKVQFRVFDLDKFDGNVIKIVPRPSHTSGDMSNNVFGDVEIGGQPLNASMVSLAVDTADAQAGITQPTAATTRLTIITTMLASGRVGIPLSNGQLKASGGSGSLTWNLVSGDLPPGLTLSSSGLISGTPTTVGTFTFTVRVVDAIQQVATRELTLGIAPPLGIAALVFVAQPAPCTSTLSSTANCVRQNVPISPTVTVRALGPDGVPVPNVPISISIGGSEGTTMPGGANTAVTNASGVAAFSTLTISEPGLFTLVASAPNFSLATTAPFNVISNIQIATTSLSDGVRLSPYTGLLLATGGVGTKTWTVTDGILPPGLSLGVNTGQIAGIPTTSGIFIFTVRVTDSGFPQQSDSRSLSIRIAEPLVILDSVLPDANLGTNYTQQVNASGGIAPLTWQVAPGSVLPPGLSFSSAGVLFGIPTTVGNFNFSVQVSDSSVPAQVATRALSLAVLRPIFVANFDSEPLGPLATQPNTNPLPLSRPTVIIRDEGGIVDVVAPTLGFTTRSMLLDGTPGNLADAAFFNPQQFFSGQAVIQWRSSIAAIPPSDASGRIGVFVEANDDNVFKDVWKITYEPSGILTIGGAPGPNIGIVGYTPGTPTQFRLVLDLDKHTYSLSVNGALAASGNLDAQLGFNHTVFDNINRFSEANYPALAVDDVNIAVTTPIGFEN